VAIGKPMEPSPTNPTVVMALVLTAITIP
jgi:hypothetical protein